MNAQFSFYFILIVSANIVGIDTVVLINLKYRVSGILGAKLILPVNEIKIIYANLRPKMLYRRVIGVQRESCFLGLVIRNRRQTQMRLLLFLQ